MVLNDLKAKGVECLVNNFNIEHEGNSGTIIINNVFHCNTNSIEIDNGQIMIKRYINDRVIITGCISIDDVNSMYYMDDCCNIVSLHNIEF